MAITRTPDMEVNAEFVVDVPVTKAYVDRATGERYIVGVATGLAEDRDGERVSKNAIVGMGRKIQSGQVKVTSSHQQDWWSEIGDVCKYEYDGETDEMIVDGVLPPEGVDPIADKAWREANKPNSKLGWSIGGKLLKSYFERNEIGKKRKVLDAIDLRHVALTKNPSYPHSFAEAVAKSFTDWDEPTDDEFTLLVDVEKADATGSWASGDSDSGGGNTGRDSVGSGQRNAGQRKPGTKGMSTEDDGSDQDDDDTKDLPEGKDQERHLACPNCGHEFAADLPVDPDERQVDDTNNDDEDGQDDDEDTGKTSEETLMSKLTETLDSIRALVDGSNVAKDAKTDPEPEVAKTETPNATATGEPTDVEKMIAASHLEHEKRLSEIEEGVGKGFELVAKAFKDLQEAVLSQPQGRKSVARVHPSGEGTPSSVGHGDGGTVEKTGEERAKEAETATDALKALNSEHPAYAGR